MEFPQCKIDQRESAVSCQQAKMAASIALQSEKFIWSVAGNTKGNENANEIESVTVKA